jgi:hypothetical protein
MPHTRRVFDMLENLAAEPEQVRTLLTTRSSADASLAFSFLRATLPEGPLVLLANLREIIAEIPETPFLTGRSLDILERSEGYERHGRTYRRTFENEHGAFGLEFEGGGTECEAIFLATSSGRFTFGGDVDSIIDQHVCTAALTYRTVIDELVRALQALGLVLYPRIYVSTDDFVEEYSGAAAAELFGGLF